MHLGIRLVWPALLALQTFALGAAPALSATKVSFGQVSPTATVWPGVVAAKKGFFAANGVEMDMVSIGVSPGMQAVAAGSLNIMHNTCNAVISFIEFGRQGNPSVAGLHGQPSGRRGRQEGSQERERAEGQGGGHLVDQVWLDHSAAPAAEGARARAVRLRRGRRTRQRADFQRAAGRRARRGLAGAAAIVDRHRPAAIR